MVLCCAIGPALIGAVAGSAVGGVLGVVVACVLAATVARPLVVALGIVALGLYGVVAALQPSNEFGRVLAAYGGVFIIGSMLWGVAFDGFHPGRADLIGATLCLMGVGVIMYAR